MKRFVPLTGKKTTKTDLMMTFEGQILEKKIQDIARLFQNDRQLIDAVLDKMAKEIDSVLITANPINDIDELQYFLAIIYTQLKSKWILFNMKINYTVEAGGEPSDDDVYSASALTHVIDLIEPLTHPDAVKTVTETLGQQLREIKFSTAA